MKSLPYFHWYPADAETDANFRAMDDADIGFYIRCLNHAWINGGIPADPKERARVLRTRLDTANKRWLRVGKCFTKSLNDELLFVNSRQETERESACSKSLKASESAKARYERSANAPLRASDSVYDSVSAFDLNKKPSLRSESELTVRAVADAFSDWLKPWPRCASPDMAARAWLSTVTGDVLSLAFAARDRYLASDEVRRGAVMEPAKWLFAQKDAGWCGKWPVAMPRESDRRPATTAERVLEKMKQRIVNGENPL